MQTAKIIPFPTSRNNPSGDVYKMFSKDVADSFMKYHELGIEWRNKFRKQTLYKGYPLLPPGKPVIDDLVWFTDEQKNFGVWIYNQSGQEIEVNEKVEFGWSPFIRKSVAPSNEPIHIQSAEFRKSLVWVVDEEGYGQYGIIKKSGDIWIPHPKPNS